LIGLTLVTFGLSGGLLAGTALVMPESLQPDYRDALPYTSAATQPTASPEEGTPIGTIDIPRLGLASLVLEGDGAGTLFFGVGHLPDTPLPWHGGNSVLAAHRDTFFRDLEGIRVNDVIRFRTADASLEYRVTDTRIVDPDDVHVLAPTDGATLTLITCYPFRYIGPAPRRFVVRATRDAAS
jgi:sortase A